MVFIFEHGYAHRGDIYNCASVIFCILQTLPAVCCNQEYRICRNKCPPRIKRPPKTVIFQRGEYTKPMGFDGWFFKGGEYTKPMAFDGFWSVLLLLLKIKRSGRLFWQIRYFVALNVSLPWQQWAYRQRRHELAVLGRFRAVSTSRYEIIQQLLSPCGTAQKSGLWETTD